MNTQDEIIRAAESVFTRAKLDPDASTAEVAHQAALWLKAADAYKPLPWDALLVNRHGTVLGKTKLIDGEQRVQASGSKHPLHELHGRAANLDAVETIIGEEVTLIAAGDLTLRVPHDADLEALQHYTDEIQEHEQAIAEIRQQRNALIRDMTQRGRSKRDVERGTGLSQKSINAIVKES